MTEQSQMPLVGPPKRRGWREIVRFRPLTASTNAALVVTRRGRLVSILPAGGPRVLSDYLAWPYHFREVDARERLLVLDQRLESFDSGYEFSVSLRLIYQVVRPDRVALELDDVSSELAHAVVQSLRLSGRSFGVEQDKAFEEHLQETLVNGDALVQRIQLLGLALRRVDVAVTLDEPTRLHAEALRFAMRERPLHFQVTIESLEPDRSFDVIVGGFYRLTERRIQDGVSDATDSAIQLAITRTLRRVGITFEPSNYSSAAKEMAEILRKDALLQSELLLVHAELLRPTVQIQPDRSMVHVPRPNMLRVQDTRPDTVLRRSRQSLPRLGRPPALVDMQESAPQQAPAPAMRRALPPPELQPQPDDVVAPPAVRPELQPEAIAASQILPLGELPAPGNLNEDSHTLWPPLESMPVMRAPTTLGQPDDARDADAPWADLIKSAEAEWPDQQWPAAPSAHLAEPVEPPLWESAAEEADHQAVTEQHTPLWSPAPPADLAEPVEPPPWESAAEEADHQPALGATFAAEQAEHGLNANPEPAIAAPAFSHNEPPVDLGFLLNWIEPSGAPAAEPSLEMPAPVDKAIADDLGFSLDWSDPEAAPEAEGPASTPAPAAPAVADGLDFTLDWSKPQPAPYASAWVPSGDTSVDGRVIMAHWDDLPAAVPEPALFSDPSLATYDSSDPVTVDLNPASDAEIEPAQPELEQAHTADVPLVAEQAAVDDEAPAVVQQESSPWYTPTMQLDDHLSFDRSADGSSYAPLEAFGMAWAEQSAAPSPPAYDLAADAFSHMPAESVDQELAAAAEPAYELAADADTPPVDETFDAAGEDLLAAPSVPAYGQAADSFSHTPAESPDQEPTSDLVPDAVDEPMEARSEEAQAIPTELVARIIGLIQSYGPAWFKMWSLELKERPERLPVVLGEVTADSVLLAQAEDPRVQSALLAALAVYTSPVTFPSRLPASVPLPIPAIAGQTTDGEDEVPDWLNLRVKWNGHGGGA